MLRKTALSLALAAIGFDASAQAQASDNATTQLGEITVSATRTERKTDAVPNTISVYTLKELQERNARDLKDLLGDEVDLSIRAATPRFGAALGGTGRGGNESLNIRGLEGNQVLVMQDGVSMPLSYNFGPFSSGRLDLIEVDMLAGAEVLRGPASAQFGSDGLAGALTLRTLKPEDLLKGGKTFAGFATAGGDTVDDSFKLTGAAAASSGDWSGLLMFTVRDGHETSNQGSNDAPNSTRTKPNPTDIRTQSVMGKAGLRLNAQNRLLATVDARQRKIDANELSGVAPTASASTSVIGLTANDEIKRQRVSLEHRYEDLNADWLHSLTTQVYFQNSKTSQFSAEDRNTAADRTRLTTYRERLIGLSSQGQTQLSGQRLSYGLDLSRNQITALRDGITPGAGDPLPAKPFPDTDYTQAGAFVQDEIDAGDFTLIPALRFEHYSLKPKADGYTAALVKLSDQAITPRLGAIWRVSPEFQPYAQWALGFRAPTPDQVNNAFSNPAQGYTSIGNANLKAEHANSVEVGVRGKLAETLRWQLSAYDNRYRDFISQEIVGGTGAPGNPLVFQFINLAEARIKGIEARLVWTPLRGWTVSSGFAKSSGHSTTAGVDTPLDTVQPQRLSLSTRYESGAWSVNAQWQHANAKKAGSASSASYFLPKSFNTLDVGGSYAFTSQLRLNASITNLTDTKYWRWSDVRGIAANSTVIDAYTAPGRAFQLSLRADF